MGARVIADVSKLAVGLKKAAGEANKLTKALGRTKGGGSGGSRRPIVITDIRTPRGSYYDENARALGL